MMQGCSHHPGFVSGQTTNFLFVCKTIRCYSLEEEEKVMEVLVLASPQNWNCGMAWTVQGPDWGTEKYCTEGQRLN